MMMMMVSMMIVVVIVTGKLSKALLHNASFPVQSYFSYARSQTTHLPTGSLSEIDDDDDMMMMMMMMMMTI